MAWPDVASLITPPRTELDLENQYALPHVRGAPRPLNGLTFRAQEGPPGESGPTWGKEGMQPGVVGLRGALIAAWEDDLRAVRQDTYDVGRGREALVFMQRLYGLISSLRAPIQRSWGPGGHVHVVDSPEIGGPGPRVSQSRIRLRNHGDVVVVELFAYVDGSSRANPDAGLDREIRVAEIEPLDFVTELYRTAVGFLQVALNLDLLLGDASWLFEHAAANHFVSAGQWATVGDVYRLATREFAVADSFETVSSLLEPKTEASASNGSNGSGGDEAELHLSIEQLQRYVEPQPDLENFLGLVQLAVAADQEDVWVASGSVAASLDIDALALTKLGRLVATTPDVCREGEFAPDYAEWTFLPSYNVHFFRRVHTIDDFLVVQNSLLPRAAGEGTTTTSPGTAGTAFKVEEGAALPDGIVTFLMTDVVESTPLWLASRGSMYQTMRRHDQLLTSAIEANAGIVLKERGEGDSFFAVFPRATDAVVAAVEAQRAIQSEPWPDRIALSVRMAVLTGEADAQDRDYRSPAVNRCAKLRRRAVGNQILVSETTYSIVADILRSDIQLVSVGKRRLEGHDRQEEVYVVQNPEVELEAGVAGDDVEAAVS
ncbi:MAG: adenylate/guanylate cyclase domain-containing protein [Chloroflexi bacterium]|nr:MAG: adenylate/guanylate cyclase domain-containing protein [Chloroflexota bacterium]